MPPQSIDTRRARYSNPTVPSFQKLKCSTQGFTVPSNPQKNVTTSLRSSWSTASGFLQCSANAWRRLPCWSVAFTLNLDAEVCFSIKVFANWNFWTANATSTALKTRNLAFLQRSKTSYLDFKLLLADWFAWKNLRRLGDIYNVYNYWHDSGSYNY